MTTIQKRGPGPGVQYMLNIRKSPDRFGCYVVKFYRNNDLLDVQEIRGEFKTRQILAWGGMRPRTRVEWSKLYSDGANSQDFFCDSPVAWDPPPREEPK